MVKDILNNKNLYQTFVQTFFGGVLVSAPRLNGPTPKLPKTSRRAPLEYTVHGQPQTEFQYSKPKLYHSKHSEKCNLV